MIANLVKIVLHMSNYATKYELHHTGDIDTSDLAAKKDFIAFKVELQKLDINPLSASVALIQKLVN